mmetsp:Transcript_9783/g.20301  ORF Transcript_9783/g.20301 Transcript_9783/m.20301 type:complete len:310 (-) Transcript_9783:100-1029(-)
MGSQESLARSLSAIHKGNSKRHGSLHFLDIPSLPFGSEESNATASDANNPSGLQRRSTYSHSQPQASAVDIPRQKTILRKSSAPATLSKSMPSLRLEDSSKPQDEVLQPVNPRQQGKAMEKERCDHRGFRTDYVLGAAARSTSDMVFEADKANAFKAISSMKEHDFAFIRRSDGQWTYSILAYRSFETIRNNTEECMTFVTSDFGATKMVKKSQWVTSIRLVSKLCLPTEESGSESCVEVEEVKPKVKTKSKKVEEKTVATKGTRSWVPKSVSFPRNFDDEVSVLSNVSIPKLARRSYYKPAKQSPLKS